ncbi:MAG: hypothetical protein ACYC2G_15930 [Gemmatimonadaceae bacterium]
MTTTHHLVTVWDPSRGPEPLQAHLQLLLDLRRRERAGELEDEDVYVWWGKIRSPNRQQPLPHLDQILTLDDVLRGDEGPDAEVHLYLTDYRSLYVGHVGEVTTEDVRRPSDGDVEPEAVVPLLYDGVECDCWFRLLDVRRIVHDDTLGVVEELRKLRNVRYHDRPVSIYGGMVELPLVVRRDDGARWFEPQVRERLIEGRSWAEFDAESTGLGSVERDLRENMLGDAAWLGLDPAARTFVASAEKIFRDHRAELAFDFSPVLVNLAKAVEVQVNDLLRRALRTAAPAARRANVDGQTVDVVEDGPFSLGQLARIIGGEREVNEALAQRLEPARWVTGSLPSILEELAAMRNPAAHRVRLNRDQVGRLRDRLVGVGCVGGLVELGGVRVVS